MEISMKEYANDILAYCQFQIYDNAQLLKY